MQFHNNLAKALDKAPNIAIFSVDENKVITSWNEGAQKLYGYKKEDAIGEKVDELIIPSYMRDYFWSDLKEKRGSELEECEYKRSDNSIIIVNQNIVYVDDQIYFFVLEPLQAKAHHHLNEIIDSDKVEDKLVIISFDSQWKIDSFNSIAQEFTGYLYSDVKGKDFLEIFVPKSFQAKVKERLKNFQNDRRSSTKAISFPIICANGTKKIMHWDKSVKSGSRGDERIFLIGSDFKDSEATLGYLANYDPLTDLPNRRQLLQNLQDSMNKAARVGESVITLFLSVDNFKSINRTFGYNFGDEILRKIGERLGNNLRDYDSVARFSSDEFVIIFEGVDSDLVASALAQRVISLFEEPFEIENHKINLNVNIGVSSFPSHANDPKTLINYANKAMQKAKEEGLNRYKIFKAPMNDEVTKRVMIEKSLKQALENGEFYVVYQPQVDTKTKRIVGAEALVRWNHPKQNNIPPLDFIPIAEDTGMILDIGRLVLKEAIAQTKKWHDKGYDNLKLSVNISGIQLLQSSLYKDIEDILHESGLDPQFLELELTESVLMENLSLATMVLDRFKQKGIKISIDDFGTGYSSFRYLRELPFDLLKIDHSFIIDIMSNSRDKAIVSSIVTMVQEMGLQVVAEGVEKSAQYNYLKELGCDFIQGYYFSKPLGADEFEKVLGKGTLEGKEVSSEYYKVEEELKKLTKPQKMAF